MINSLYKIEFSLDKNLFKIIENKNEIFQTSNICCFISFFSYLNREEDFIVCIKHKEVILPENLQKNILYFLNNNKKYKINEDKILDENTVEKNNIFFLKFSKFVNKLTNINILNYKVFLIIEIYYFNNILYYDYISKKNKVFFNKEKVNIPLLASKKVTLRKEEKIKTYNNQKITKVLLIFLPILLVLPLIGVGGYFGINYFMNRPNPIIFTTQLKFGDSNEILIENFFNYPDPSVKSDDDLITVSLNKETGQLNLHASKNSTKNRVVNVNFYSNGENVITYKVQLVDIYEIKLKEEVTTVQMDLNKNRKYIIYIYDANLLTNFLSYLIGSENIIKVYKMEILPNGIGKIDVYAEKLSNNVVELNLKADNAVTKSITFFVI